MFIDTHCHLTKSDYENLDEVIKKMDKNIIIVSGADAISNKEALELSKKHKNIYCTLGIHPTEITENIEEDLNFIINNINNPKVVGIGEIGLDYHFECDKEKQKLYFKKQLDIANKYNKPIVIHSRDSYNDTYNILKEYPNLKKNMHCYSYSLECARELIKLNCKLGIGGVLTFKNAKKLCEVVENIDIKNLLLETDSPYLTPEPFRGKRNEPYNSYYVACKIAELKQITLDKVLDITTRNAIAQFDLPINI